MSLAERLARAARVAISTLGNVRMRLTLWYLAILAIVILVFSGILLGEVRANDEAAQRRSLMLVAQRLVDVYNASDGLIHYDQVFPQPVVKQNATQVMKPRAVAQAPVTSKRAGDLLAPFPVSPLTIMLFLDAHGNVTQTVGAITPDGQQRLLAALRASEAFQRGGNEVGAMTPTFTDLSVPMTMKGGAAIEQDDVIYITDVVSGGRWVGTLIVGAPNAVDQTTSHLAPALLIAAPVTLLVAALGGYWLASRALRPVRLITRAARQMSETDLSQRLDIRRQDELGELAATFDGMLERLDAAFRRQRQFTADASHELRTPLTIVNLEVSRALAMPRTSEEYIRALSAIQAENQYMSPLVNDLLTLARADASTTTLRLVPLDLSEIALEAVERLAALAHEHAIRLVVGSLPELQVVGDRSLLSQALTNLVTNAILHSSGIGTSVDVDTYVERRDGRTWAVASVSDDGPGIAPNHLPHLFDRFYRVESARTVAESATAAESESSGSGLGLAIVQWVAHAHGGEARVRSVAGEGARFELCLPEESATV